jgi:hypothetical protein
MNASNFIKAVTTLSIAASLTGCASQEQPPSTVFSPVVASKPPLPARPTLTIASMPEGASCGVQIPLYAQSLAQCQGYAEQLEAILKK